MRIEVNTMVTLTIASQFWIGQVVEIIGDVALVRLADNMHYHAKMNELALFTKTNKCSEKKEQKEEKK